jgi:hypothetical protein
MGGDEVYPTSGRDAYNVKKRAPYHFAYPDQTQKYIRPFSLSQATTIGTMDWSIFLPSLRVKSQPRLAIGELSKSEVILLPS